MWAQGLRRRGRASRAGGRGASAAVVAMVRRTAHDRRRSEAMNAENTGSTSEVQLDNGIFRVTRWTIEPDGVIPMHRHDYEYVVVPMVTDSMHVRNADGSSTVADLKAGVSYTRAAGAEHEISNPDGTDDVVFVEIERL